MGSGAAKVRASGPGWGAQLQGPGAGTLDGGLEGAECGFTGRDAGFRECRAQVTLVMGCPTGQSAIPLGARGSHGSGFPPSLVLGRGGRARGAAGERRLRPKASRPAALRAGPLLYGRQVSVSLRVPGPSRPRGAVLTLLSGRAQQVGSAGPERFPRAPATFPGAQPRVRLPAGKCWTPTLNPRAPYPGRGRGGG